VRVAAERLARAAEAYRVCFEAFYKPWRQTSPPDSDRAPDIRAGLLMDRLQQLNRLLGDFLFQAAAPLDTMNEQIDALSADPDAAARHHTLIAAATRQVHRLRTAHHMFEFCASDVRSINNFRLDAALKSARGLHRRCTDRMRMIDDRLQREAYQFALQQRERRIAECRQRIEEIRREVHGQIAALLESQDQLTASLPLADSFLYGRFTAGEQKRQLERLEADAQATRQQLAQASARRISLLDPDGITVADQSASPRPVNFARRLAAGWLVTATVLLAILFGLRLAGRRHA
jgi:hypothetical protein